MNFLSNRYAKALSVVLLLQAGAFYAIASRPEHSPVVAPLSLFPLKIGSWQMVQEIPFEKEVLDILKADDTLNRVYQAPGAHTPVYLTIEYFKTQRTGQTPHSPKNCLPGSGWEPVFTDRPAVPVAGRAEPIVINRYVSQHGFDKSIVLYWYQSHNRVIASEYLSKFWLVADAIRYHRSDISMVKVVVPVAENDINGATTIATGFVNVLFPALETQLPL